MVRDGGDNTPTLISCWERKKTERIFLHIAKNREKKIVRTTVQTVCLAKKKEKKFLFVYGHEIPIWKEFFFVTWNEKVYGKSKYAGILERWFFFIKKLYLQLPKYFSSLLLNISLIFTLLWYTLVRLYSNGKFVPLKSCPLFVMLLEYLYLVII